MRIAQIVAAGAGEYERKSQRIDFASLSQAGHEVAVYDDIRSARDVQLAHVYGRAAGRVRLPHVIDAEVELPEAVEEGWWEVTHEHRPPERYTIGTFARRGVENMVQQTYARLSRTHDDVDWRLFERAPAPGDLQAVDVWVDPAVDDRDRDGFVAEALVAGNVVVASRTILNGKRLESGRTGFLVPRNDPNEVTHAILAALFKPELSETKTAAARQTIAKFRPRQRFRALTALYDTLLR